MHYLLHLYLKNKLLKAPKILEITQNACGEISVWTCRLILFSRDLSGFLRKNVNVPCSGGSVLVWKWITTCFGLSSKYKLYGVVSMFFTEKKIKITIEVNWLTAVAIFPRHYLRYLGALCLIVCCSSLNSSEKYM